MDGGKESFIELRARDRAKSVLDEGTFRELIDPFQRVESPIFRFRASSRKVMMV